MKTKMRKKRKRTRIGSSLASVALLLLVLGPSLLTAKKKKPAAEAYGLVGVTVFREPGFALAGAEVILEPNPEPGKNPNIKPMKDKSGARGEVVFRVPTEPMRYAVRASGKGYVSQQKDVSIEGEQRMDVTFMLAPESK
jgi:hypothetical protein